MSKTFHTGLELGASERIYKELLSVGTPTANKTAIRGRIHKRPTLSHSKQRGHDQDSDLQPLEIYNFHYKKSPGYGKLQADGNSHDIRKQHNTSPCPSAGGSGEEDSMVKMLQIRASSAYVKDPECYRNPEFFMSCTPTERRKTCNQKPVWNHSDQALRLNKEWMDKAQCRATKRYTESVKHRTDKMYILNGAGLDLKNRYSIPDGETQHLKELSLARLELRNEIQKATEMLNRCRNSLRSSSGTESDQLPRLSAKSKDLVTESNAKGIAIPQTAPSDNLQNKGLPPEDTFETLRISVEGTHQIEDQHNGEIKAEVAEGKPFPGVEDEQEHTAVDKRQDDQLLSTERIHNHPNRKDSRSSADNVDSYINGMDANDAINDYTAVGVDPANNIDIAMVHNTEFDQGDISTLPDNADSANNQYEEEADAALQFYGEEEVDEDDDDDDRLSIEDDGVAYQNVYLKENYDT